MIINVPANDRVDITTALTAATGATVTVEPASHTSSQGFVVLTTTTGTLATANPDDGVPLYQDLQFFGSIRAVEQATGELICLVNDTTKDISVRAYV